MKKIKSTQSKKEFFNKKARFDYEILETFEAGIVLTGNEIKAIRSGRINLSSSYAKVMGKEVFWLGGDINVEEGDRQRTRKLLLHKSQIKKFIGKSSEKGLSLIPLKLYIKKGKAKLLLGIGRGKKKRDKREIIKQREE